MERWGSGMLEWCKPFPKVGPEVLRKCFWYSQKKRSGGERQKQGEKVPRIGKSDSEKFRTLEKIALNFPEFGKMDRNHASPKAMQVKKVPSIGKPRTPEA